MGSFTFALCLILIDYGANSFSVPTGFKAFQPPSSLQTKSDPDVFPLKENTITNLGLKLAKILTNTNAKDCLKTCQRTEGCLRVVHCKTKNKCDPGTFCLMKETSTCYLAAKTGRLLKTTGTCTFTKGVHPKGNGFQADEKALSPFNVQAESRFLPMNDQKTTEEIVPKESLKMDGVLKIKTSENKNELVVNESAKMNGFSLKLHSETFGNLVGHESIKENSISVNNNHYNVDEIASQGSPNVDGISDDIDYDNLDKTLSKDSLKVAGISDKNDLGMVDIKGSQESSNVDGLSDNIDYDNLDETASQDFPNVDGITDKKDFGMVDIKESQESSNVDGLSDNIDYDDLDETASQDFPNVDGITDKKDFGMVDIKASQESSNVDGLSDNIDYDNLDETLSTDSATVDGISDKIDLDMVDITASHVSANVDGISDNIDYGKLDQRVSQDSPNVDGILDNTDLDMVDITSSQVSLNVNGISDDIEYGKLDRLSGNISSTQAGLVSDESLMSEALSGNFTTEKSSGIVSEGPPKLKGNKGHLHVAKQDELVRQESLKDGGSLGNSSMALNDLENAMDQLGSYAHDSNISNLLLSLVDTDTSQKPNHTNTLQNESTFKSVLQNQTNLFNLAKGDNSGTNKSQESRIPEECQKEPTYVNQGAVRKRKFNRPGYPVVIEYECDETAKEKYKYLAGPREALCDTNGTWTLPAMFCNPTSCFSRVADSSKTVATLYGGDSHQDEEGRECQAWEKDEPHSHSFIFKLTGSCYGCGAVQHLDNKCRDRDNEGKPWCYTMDPNVRWKFCDVPECAKETTCSRPPYLRSAPALRTMVIGRNVHVTYRCHPDLKYLGGRNTSICDMETGVWKWSDLLCSSEKCFHYDHQRRKAIYHGKESTTKTGKICQRWDSQYPQKHTKKVSQFPGATHLSELGNMCRDPDKEGAPWCYTTNPTSRWEFCSVPECTLST